MCMCIECVRALCVGGHSYTYMYVCMYVCMYICMYEHEKKKKLATFRSSRFVCECVCVCACVRACMSE